MKKDLGVKPYVFPMPVLMIATYGENDKVDVMNMAWGGICDNNMVALNISEGHKTAKNIKERKAFTLSIADVDHLEESDFFGTASGNTMEDTDLAFEYSEVDADIKGNVISIKNPKSGTIMVDSVGEIIHEDSIMEVNGKVVIREK